MLIRTAPIPGVYPPPPPPPIVRTPYRFSQPRTICIYILLSIAADRRNRHYYITFVFVWVQRTLCAVFSAQTRARIMYTRSGHRHPLNKPFTRRHLPRRHHQRRRLWNIFNIPKMTLPAGTVVVVVDPNAAAHIQIILYTMMYYTFAARRNCSRLHETPYNIRVSCTYPYLFWYI